MHPSIAVWITEIWR